MSLGCAHRTWQSCPRVHVNPHLSTTQNLAFLGPAVCMLPLLAGTTQNNGTLDVALITAALGLSSFSLAGLYCSHQDMSPKYAGG